MRFLTFGFLLFSMSCGSQQNAILVDLQSVPDSTQTVEVSATLSGKQAMSPLDFTTPFDTFGVQFDPSVTGALTLNVMALDSEDCEQASGALTYALPIDFMNPSLALNAQSPRQCGKGSLPGCAANSVCPITKLGTDNIESFWAASPLDIWAVGHAGTVLHYDGTGWKPYDWGTFGQPTQDLFGIWGSSPTDIWAVGFSGLIVHYDGSKWTQKSFSTIQDLKGVWGVSDSNIWAVGTSPTPGTTQGIFLHYDGSSWTSIPTAGNDNFNSVWADNSSGSNFIYACGDNGLLVRYDSSKTPAWSAIVSNTGVKLNGIWGTRSSQAGMIDSTVFAVGVGGTILRFRYGMDTGWMTLTNTGTSLALYGVRGDDTKKLVYAYGQNGTVVSAGLTSDTFTAQSVSTSSSIFGGAFSGGSLVWFGGAGGSLNFLDLNP